MQFKLDGKQLGHIQNYSIERVKKFLDNMPDGELVTAQQLTRDLKLQSYHYVRDRAIKELPAYAAKVGNKIVFGNLKTVKALKNEIQS